MSTATIWRPHKKTRLIVGALAALMWMHAFCAEPSGNSRIVGVEETRDSAIPTSNANATAGRKIFKRKCSGCHSVSDLRGIATKYQDANSLQQAWLMPRLAFPLTAAISTPNSSAIEGSVVYVDEFLVTIRLADGVQRTFKRHPDGSGLIIRDLLAAHKSELSSYDDEDIHNVTAYLGTLKQEQHGAAEPERDHNLRSSTAAFASDITEDEKAPVLNFAAGSWSTYSGDYSGRRYSLLAQINQTNVQRLTLAWTTRLATANSKSSHRLVLGGQGSLDTPGTTNARGSILFRDGYLYASTPDSAWAVDARSGNVLWQFKWKPRGAGGIGNRGLGMWRNSLYLGTSDNYLVALDANTGDLRWQAEIASFEQNYFSSSPAPIIIGDSVLVGTANFTNAPGFLKSVDALTGNVQWMHYSVPMKPDDPGLQTWRDLDTAQHGGGQVWMPGSYDPVTQLYIYGTGNPTPAFMAHARGNKDALFTCSMIAVDVRTGQMAWHYQTSPNDTHDWDSAQTPILADIVIGGKLRKVAMTAARNGYFFVVDRTTGEHLLTSKFSDTVNWAKPALNNQGQPVRIPEKDSHPAGALVSSDSNGAANWQPASYSEDSKLFYVPVAESWAVYYKKNATDGVGMDHRFVHADYYLKAIDPTSGRVVWSVKYPAGEGLPNGILTTAGRLLFSGDTRGNLVARDPATGHPLWHARIGTVSNAPQTYSLDGRQHILVAAGDMLYAFVLYSDAL